LEQCIEVNVDLPRFHKLVLITHTKCVLSSKWPDYRVGQKSKPDNFAITFPHPTYSLPQISHVPLGVGGWPLGYEERTCWSNWPCN